MLIDTHTHLDNKAYFDDVQDVITKAIENNITKFIIPGTNKVSLQKALEISKINEDVFFALGFHPCDVLEYDEKIFIDNIDNKKCVAIGECGLDYFYSIEHKTLQQEIFRKHIQLAKKYNKPLIIHIRDSKDNFDASYDAKRLLIEENAKEVGGVLHCFNANIDLLSLSEHNFYFGIGGIVSFKNAKDLVGIISKIPIDKLLIETDSPYLTPHPHRGKRNEPFYIKYVFSKISEILDIPCDKLEDILYQNTKSIFKEIF
jgi:TatD DNase family protein